MNRQRLYLIALSFLSLPSLVFAAGAGKSEGLRLAVSQGISSPNNTSPVNLSHGFVRVNPAVAGSLSGVNLSVEYGSTTTNNQKSTTTGAEIGAGNGKFGIALGSIKSDCSSCESRESGILGFSLDSFSVGLGFQKDKNYSLGLIINPTGTHRFGLVANAYDSPNDGEDVQAYGLGYSYFTDSVVFTVDASKRKTQTPNPDPNDDVILVTPGLEIRADWVSLSVSHDAYTNNKLSTYTNNTWYGIGFGSKDLHLAVYHDYFHEWSAVGTFFF